MSEIAEKKTFKSLASTRQISVVAGVAIVAGMVIGPGIFKTPPLVAANGSNELITLILWAAGGFISFLGALCYAELASSYPHAGGEYHYLVKSFGKQIAFLFGWARMTVIQTGSIALLSFVIGDYASEVFNLGPYSSSAYAVITVFILTLINLLGIHSSSKLQKALMFGLLLGLALIIVLGLISSSPGESLAESTVNTNMAIGQAMIFVLLTYGGWNEAAYLSADVVHTRSGIIKVLFYSIGLITIVYMLVNYSLIKGLGFNGIIGTEIVASDLVSKVMGEEWVKIISAVIAISALSTVNAVMITGARTNYALGNDFNRFHFLSQSNENDKAPVNAFLFQTAIALLLILLGTFTRNGFVTMVEYTAPVFWFFFLLVGLSLFILRKKEPDKDRPFLVPLYPVIPLLFCVAAGFMLYSSLAYTGIGALVGVIVLLIGVPFLFFERVKLNLKEEKI